ncbi:hypothetical protein [Paractinoplanes rishiriensis]|uniref:Uncharacterized protein n=1 Tax=Paractinoplanes rishiriensis TaxID=1050105 RepID=A0A919KBD6_9ACTN|nr:hypothetical protein [Actinoplanes rishiriensis]GIF02230.1 hypothetical protein Ari01nite_96940 [Actinoplanes rishiriensis]
MAYYGVDLTQVIAGHGPAPSLVLALAQRLPDTSLTVALAAGGRQHFGWGVDRHLMADVFDAVNQNTRATGHWAKGKAPTIPAWPRPKPAGPAADPSPRRPVTVADLYQRFQRR